MCEKCIVIDAKIDHYHCLSRFVTDQAALEGIKQLIAQMKAKKAVLHPDQAV